MACDGIWDVKSSQDMQGPLWWFIAWSIGALELEGFIRIQPVCFGRLFVSCVASDEWHSKRGSLRPGPGRGSCRVDGNKL